MSWQFYTDAGVIKSQGGGGGTINAIDDINDVDVTGAVDGALLRYEATGTQWNDTTSSTLLLSDAGQLQVPTTGSTGGLLVGGDVNFYRSAANVGKTDDDFTVGSANMFSFEVSGSRFALSDANIDHIDSGTDNYMQWRASADTQPRIRIGIGVGSGTTPGIAFGPGGATATDTEIRRTGVNTLRTEATLNFGNNLTINNLGTISDLAGSGRLEFTGITTPTSTVVIRAKGSADTQYRYTVEADGDTLWGAGGVTAPDVALRRTAANVLAFDAGDKLQQNFVATQADDVTNQAYVDRIAFLMGA